MTRRRGRRPPVVWLAAAAGAGFLAGMAAMSASSRLITVRDPPVVELHSEVRTEAVAPAVVPSGPPIIAADPTEDLRKRRLQLPVEGLTREELRDTFNEARGSDRRHEALDILAPRNTPVLAVEDGRVAKLFSSKAGGLTVYQFDPTSTYAYYYAHLERYADGLKDGDHVQRGQVLGYVGTSGNAPADTPHLHFAIFRLTDEKRWWQGTAIDPYPILTR